MLFHYYTKRYLLPSNITYTNYKEEEEDHKMKLSGKPPNQLQNKQISQHYLNIFGRQKNASYQIIKKIYCMEYLTFAAISWLIVYYNTICAINMHLSFQITLITHLDTSTKP